MSDITDQRRFSFSYIPKFEIGPPRNKSTYLPTYLADTKRIAIIDILFGISAADRRVGSRPVNCNPPNSAFENDKLTHKN